MVKIKRKDLICIAMLVMAMAAPAVASLESVTVATFADPAEGGLEPLFIIDYHQGVINGGLSSTGLTLEVPIADTIYADVTFTMDELNFDAHDSAGGYYTNDGPYAIRFFDGVKEVIKMEFDRVWIKNRNSGLDAQDVYGDNVTISGVDFDDLTGEHFGFTFVNISDDGDSVQATASFTSSAIPSAVPEPATIAILALGGLFLGKRRG